MPNKFKATWASHSSIGDFLKCPRAYYLKNVYKTDNGNKISIVSPYLSLGSAVHEVLEPLAELDEEHRDSIKLAPAFYKAWAKISGEIGGFQSKEQEEEFKQRGVEMLTRVGKNRHNLAGQTTFLLEKRDDLPWMWLSEDENLILCGKLDFLIRLGSKSYKVLDFKSGSKVESDESLQLPIYSVLLTHFLGKIDIKAYYWYAALHDDPIEKEMPDPEKSRKTILEVALRVKEARLNKDFDCPRGGCIHCQDLERVANGEGKFLGLGQYGTEMYTLKCSAA